MSADSQHFTFWSFVKGLGKFFLGLVLLLQGLVGLALLLLFLGFVIGLSTTSTNDYALPDKFTLVVDPSGFLVEQRADIGTIDVINDFSDEDPPEVELRDLIDVIRAAKTDDRVQAIVLNVQELFVPTIYASKLHAIADELASFKESGKPLVAIGDFYGQEQYLLAAQADEIYLHPEGGVVMSGYGAFRLYYKSLLDKLAVSSNVFRVGQYKSALEPYMRDDMSPEAKEANMAYLEVLWRNYARSVEQARDLSDGALDRFVDNADEIVAEAGGDLAQTALEFNLVDGLMSRDQQVEHVKSLAGADSGDDARQIKLYQYLSDVRSKAKDGDEPDIGIVTAAGTIMNGEQPSGSAGGDTIAALLKQAREDEEVKAVVLRVDSPGGSSFASEIIREQVLALKEAGKPVVVSMGSLAASGGYWIAADADEIWAAPTTITGSIGIFGYFPTFEGSLAKIGVYSDGVGTSPLSGSFDQSRPLGDKAKSWIQSVIEDGYDDFLTIVSEGRELERDYVEEIAQGRPWIGETALTLGLVDGLGDLDDAVTAAATLAELEDYDVVRVQKTPSAWENFLRVLSDNVDARFANVFLKSFGADAPAARHIMQVISKEMKFVLEFNDPYGSYARCMSCAL